MNANKILKDRPTLFWGDKEKMGAIAPFPRAGYGPAKIKCLTK